MKKLNITLASALLAAIVYAGCANVLDNPLAANSASSAQEVSLDKNATTIFSGNGVKEDIIILIPD